MPEEVKILEDIEVIEVKSFGDVTEEDLVSSLSQVETLFKETGVTDVLVDTIDEESMPSTFGLYEFASDMPRKMRFAVVVKEDQPTMGDVHFVETVARNRGFQVQIFTSRSEAVSWLRS